MIVFTVVAQDVAGDLQFDIFHSGINCSLIEHNVASELNILFNKLRAEEFEKIKQHALKKRARRESQSGGDA